MSFDLQQQLPEDWQNALKPFLPQGVLEKLQQFLALEEQHYTVFPPQDLLFSAFHYTPFAQVKVLILGQDPYHEPGQACGLAFSVPEDVPAPPSLKNIFKEYATDLNLPPPDSHSLVPWAKEGVLLLNTVLTVRSGQANSHQNQGWETFTDSVIRALSARTAPVVFVLWGKSAAVKKCIIDTKNHGVIESPHPSPLSAYRGFFGSKPFSKVNQELAKRNIPEISWKLPGTQFGLNFS